MEQLHGLDSLMALGEMPNVPLHIGAVFIYKPSPSLSFDAVRALLAAQIDSHLPLLRCRLDALPVSIDRPYWSVDPEFSLDAHLQRFALPAPADWQALYELAGQFHAEPLNRQRPLWQAIYLEGLDHLQGVPKGSVALLLKIHHALADGKAAMRIFAALHSLSAEAGAPLMADSLPLPPLDFSPPSLLRKIGQAYWHALVAPYRLTGQLAAGLLSLTPPLWRNKSKASAAAGQGKTPKTVFNRMPGADRRMGHLRLPMRELRRIEAASGATINDIALCVISGALHEYLAGQQQLPAQDLVASMPISIRDDSQDKVLGNRISLANLGLYNHITEPLQRLAAIHQATHASKQHNHRRRGGSFLSMMDSIYPALVVWAGHRLVDSGLLESLPPVSNTVITNVPGIGQPAYLCGAELVDYLGLGILAPTVTLFHVVSSVPSHANITFLGCSASLADDDAYRKALQRSWRQLRAAIPAD
ncbi:MAG TPA: wax ester/triacylglycerol synthase family O-acyltransferase [Pseudomonadales bacterium]